MTKAYTYYGRPVADYVYCILFDAAGLTVVNSAYLRWDGQAELQLDGPSRPCFESCRMPLTVADEWRVTLIGLQDLSAAFDCPPTLGWPGWVAAGLTVTSMNATKIGLVIITLERYVKVALKHSCCYTVPYRPTLPDVSIGTYFRPISPGTV